MKYLIRSLALTIVLSLGVAITVAQQSCNANLSDVIIQVESVCVTLNDNQACYGNFEVNAVLQENAPPQNFNQQGDLADVVFIRSLYLSGLDPEGDRWGIAQMRLVTSTSSGTQDINLLLFGEVTVENAVDPTPELDIVVGQFPANIRNTPRANSVVLDSVASGTPLTAIGRLSDNSWVRVRVENGAVGWVARELIRPADDTQSIDILDLQDGSTPYFGPMQAFYFTDGGESQCGNVNSDGLLIQTPEGSARVTLLINEVSIELISNQNGAMALVTGNAQEGMTISMIDGEAQVTSNGTSYYVNATQKTTIGLNEDLTPNSEPSIPDNYDVQAMTGLSVLPILRQTNAPIVPNTINNTTNTDGNGNATGNTQPTNNTSDTSNNTSNTSNDDDDDGDNNSNNANGNATGNATGNANGNSNGNANGNNR